MVIWITGLSGSGKTTLGLELIKLLRTKNRNWIFLDGDMIRAISGGATGYTFKDREENGYRISKLCKALEIQGFNIIACVLSVSHSNQDYNREVFKDYREIFLDVSMEELLERDNKSLYSKAINGEIDNVVGVDIKFNKPKKPDYILKNKANIDIKEEAIKIIKRFELEIKDNYIYTQKNRINNPEKYEYSDYEGKYFLEKYEKDRCNCMLYLEKELFKIEYIKEYDINTYMYKLNKDSEIYIEKNKINTKYYLLNMLNNTFNKSKIKEKDVESIFCLLKKFEVSKKIYEKYLDRNFNKPFGSYYNYENYLLFSNLLLNLIDLIDIETKQLTIYNTVIKLNDIVSSFINELNSEELKILALRSFRLEKKIYDELKKGI